MRIMIVAMADILTCRRVLCDREVIPEIGFKGQISQSFSSQNLSSFKRIESSHQTWADLFSPHMKHNKLL